MPPGAKLAAGQARQTDFSPGFKGAKRNGEAFRQSIRRPTEGKLRRTRSKLPYLYYLSFRFCCVHGNALKRFAGFVPSILTPSYAVSDWA